jgi:hypothetical protein
METGCTAGVRFPERTRDFSLFQVVQTISGVHTTSYSMGTVDTFPGEMGPGREIDHSLPSSVEVKNVGAMPPLPHMSLWRVCLYLYHREGSLYVILVKEKVASEPALLSVIRFPLSVIIPQVLHSLIPHAGLVQLAHLLPKYPGTWVTLYRKYTNIHI